jgi:signal transduction histidine kinase
VVAHVAVARDGLPLRRGDVRRVAGDLPAIWFTLLALSFGLGAHEDGRGAIAGIGVLVAGIIATTAISGSLTVGDVAFPAVLVAAFCVAGRTARSRARLAGELHEAAARANERRAARAERAVVEERKRIAREMHDVVAHSMSVMVVQAGGARRILERDPVRARDAAELIAGTGREALVELQRLLGVLHLEPAAAPRLDGLDGLVGMRERVRIFGGELHTGRRDGGGFEVRARIPLDGRAEHA